MRYALRSLMKNPSFTAVALLALALAIGTNTAIFSVVDALLLQPLPYDHPDRLLLIWENRRGQQPISVSYPDFRDWQSQAQSIGSMAARRSATHTLLGFDEPEQIEGSEVTSELFSLLGVKPALGRTFLAEEDRPGATRVAVISDSLWQRKFHGAQDVLGKAINLDGEPFVVVGVMPAGVRYPYTHLKGEIYTSLGRLADTMGDRAGHPGIYVVGRIKPGVGLDTARADLATVAERLQRQYPASNSQIFTEAQLLQERMVSGIRPALLVLLAAVGLVLLIACANVANLLLAKAVSRRGEIAIRIALGAGWRHLIRQLLAEGVALSLIGGSLGLMLSFVGVRLLSTILPHDMPRAGEIAINQHALLFTLAISFLTGIIFGFVPVLEHGRRDLNDVMKRGARGVGGDAKHHRARAVLVIGEVALSMVLLVAAGLMMFSFFRLANTSPGIKPASVMAVQLSLPDTKYLRPDQRAGFVSAFLGRIRSIPGVESSGAVQPLPLGGSGNQVGVIDARKATSTLEAPDVITADFIRATPDYFSTIGIELLAGRPFGDRDVMGARPVCMIDETLARNLFSGESVIGRQLVMNPLHHGGAALEIVGIVKHVKSYGVDQPSRVELYVPYAQNPGFSVAVMVKSAGVKNAIVPSIREQLRQIDPNQPIANVVSMEQIVAETTAQQRLSMILLAAFAAAALLLAATGLYGVVSYSVTQRTREFGVRMALGASAKDIAAMVISQGAVLAGTGVVIGIAASVGLTRAIASLLFGVSPLDPATFIIVPAILIGVALSASYLPARRAMRVDPIVALRYD